MSDQYVGSLAVSQLVDGNVKFQITGLNIETGEVMGGEYWCIITKPEADEIAAKILGWRL
jgi:hypothetical protein